MPELRTLDQQRAAFAWEKVNALGKGLGDYLSLVRQLPAMLQTNGLGQVLAFLLTQEGTKYQIYEHLQDWLCAKAPYPVYPPAQGQEKHLMRGLTTGNSQTLRQATLEAHALAGWLKRFAEAQANANISIQKAPPGE